MRSKRKRTLTAMAFSLLGLVAVQPAAKADIVSMDLTRPPGGNIAYGVYLSPYAAKINGSSPVNVICDDFTDDTYLSESWTAEVYSGGSDPSVLQATRMATLTQQTGTTLATSYDAIAYLALQLLALGPNDTSHQALLSFAIWDIFADTAVHTWLNGYSGGASFYTDVHSIATAALGNPDAAGQRSRLTIYSPTNDAPTCGGGGCPKSPPQEFVTVRTPEASAAALLAVNLLVLVGAMFLGRRRAIRAPR